MTNLPPDTQIETLKDLRNHTARLPDNSVVMATVARSDDDILHVQLMVSSGLTDHCLWLPCAVQPYVLPDKPVANQQPMQMVDDFPRRNRLDLNEPIELLLRDAIQAVERMGAHPFLTDAVILLEQARHKVADYLESPERKDYPKAVIQEAPLADVMKDLQLGMFQTPQPTGLKAIAMVAVEDFNAQTEADRAPVSSTDSCGAAPRTPTELLREAAHSDVTVVTKYAARYLFLLSLKAGNTFRIDGVTALFYERRGYLISYLYQGERQEDDVIDIAMQRVEPIDSFFDADGNKQPLIPVTRNGATESIKSFAPITQEQLDQFNAETAADPVASVPLPAVQPTVDCLNAAFAADPNAIGALISNRVPCNTALADDPFVVVEAARVLQPGNWTVGTMGVLNGVLAANNLPLVAWKMDTTAKPFPQLTGFCAYTPPVPATEPAPKE